MLSLTQVAGHRRYRISVSDGPAGHGIELGAREGGLEMRPAAYETGGCSLQVDNRWSTRRYTGIIGGRLADIQA